MYNTIMLWRSKKLEQNNKEKDDAIIAIKVTDETYKTIRDLKNSSPLMKNVISLKNYEFSKELNENIAISTAISVSDVNSDICTIRMFCLWSDIIRICIIWYISVYKSMVVF